MMSMEGSDGSVEVGCVRDLVYVCVHAVRQCPKDIPGPTTDYAVTWSICNGFYCYSVRYRSRAASSLHDSNGSQVVSPAFQRTWNSRFLPLH
jgi:hypothetical protein